MPTLDRRLLAWSDDDDSDEEDTDDLQTAASWDSYDRCAAVFVDDVLVPGKNNGGGAERTTRPVDVADGLDGGVCARPSSGTRKACTAAGIVAVGCLCAYLAWRCGTGKPPVLS